MRILHAYNDAKQVIFNGDFARENLPASGFEPATFRPTSSSLQAHLFVNYNVGLIICLQVTNIKSYFWMNKTCDLQLSELVQINID